MDITTTLHYGTIILAVLSPVFAAVAAYSERLALDPTTQANGIIQGRRLARAALAIIPETIEAVKTKNFAAAPEIIADAVKAFEAPDPNAAPAPALNGVTLGGDVASPVAAQNTITALREQLKSAGITPTA